MRTGLAIWAVVSGEAGLPQVEEGPILDPYSLDTYKEINDNGSDPCAPFDRLMTEAIALGEVLRLMSRDGVYLLFVEERIGSSTPGKLADMVALSGNPLELDHDSLKDLEVLATIIGGRTEYCAPGRERLCPSVARSQTVDRQRWWDRIGSNKTRERRQAQPIMSQTLAGMAPWSTVTVPLSLTVYVRLAC